MGAPITNIAYFGINIHIYLQNFKLHMHTAQLVVRGGPWVTHQCPANQNLMNLLFYKAKNEPINPEKISNP